MVVKKLPWYCTLISIDDDGDSDGEMMMIVMIVNQKCQWDDSRILRTSRTTIQTKTNILHTLAV